MSWTRFFRRCYWDQERARELDAYLEAETDENIARGMSPDEARYAAHRKLGNTTLIREDIYRMNSFGWLETLWQDLRFALRLLRKNPGFTAVAVISLALGIGANSTIFSIVDTELLRPWPVRDPGRLAMISTDSGHISYPDYLDIRQQASAFSDVVAYGYRGGFISGGAQRPGLELRAQVVSQNYFAALGVKALRGRAFSSEPGQAAAEGHSVLVSYNLWQRYFGGDPSLPGKTVLLDGKEFTVIGITPQDFCGLRRESAPDIWLTLEGWETMVPGEDRWDAARDSRWFEVAGHLRPGTELSEARAQLEGLSKRLALAFPSSHHDVKFLAWRAAELPDALVETATYLMAMVGLVLLISCANVANLLLAQTEQRQREIAMRRALGAGRRRLVSQFLTEGLLLSVAGGALGILLAAWLMRLGPALVPGLADMNLKLDGRVLLFTTAISLLSVLIFGLAPALGAVKGDLTAALKGESGEHVTGRLPLRNLLVCGEIALSVVLLAGSALLLRSLRYSQGINPGFDPKKNVVMLSVAPPTLYGYNQAQAVALYPELAARVESVPGVARASYARRAPMTEVEGGET
jgi:predicted permease